MHLNQIDPRLFNPTSSELAGALTLPPLDPSNDSEDAYNPTTEQTDGIATSSSTTARPSGQSRYCSVKGCRNVIGGDYLFKMCVPCRNRYRGYGMTKRSKSKRGREIAAQELRRMRAEEDSRRAQQGLPVSDFDIWWMHSLIRLCSYFSLLASSKPPTVGLGRGRYWTLSPAQLWCNTRRYPFFPFVCARCHTVTPCCKGIIRTVAVNDIACKIGTTVNSNVCETRRSSLHHFEAPHKTLNRSKARTEIWMLPRLKLRGQGYQRFVFPSLSCPYPQWYLRAGGHRRELYPTCCSWQPSFKYRLLRQVVPEPTLPSLAVEDVRHSSGERPHEQEAQIRS